MPTERQSIEADPSNARALAGAWRGRARAAGTPCGPGRASFRRIAAAVVLGLLVLLVIALYVRAERRFARLARSHNQLVRALNDRFAAEARAQNGAAFGEALSAAGVPGGTLIGGVLSALPKPRRSWLGVETTGLRGGALVTRVMPGSPAEAAGTMRGDLVIEFNGRCPKGAGTLGRMVRSRAPGERVTVTVMRDGERIDLAATLAPPPAPPRRRGRP